MVEETVHPLEILRNRISGGDVDVLRELIAPVVEAVMAAEIDVLCGAGYGERSPARVNQRNGYRARDWDTRAGTIELQIPKLREGSYFPGWLLEPRRRAEKALLAVIADMYLAGVSTRRVDKLVQAMGIEGIQKARFHASRQNLMRSSRRSATGHWTAARTRL